MTSVIREYWGRADATHLSDCGAVVNMYWPTPRGNGYTNGSFAAAAAAALNAGMDQNSNTVSPSHMWQALAQGLTTPAAILSAAARVLAQRFRLGHFDPLESQAALLAYGPADIGTAANHEAAQEGVRQGTVLLKNDRAVLPLRMGTSLLVLGPTALSRTAASGDIYGAGGAVCPDGSVNCWPLPGEAIAEENVGGTTNVLSGVSILTNDTAAWGPAVAAAGQPGLGAIVLCLGTDRSVAGEGSDRSDISLPGVQEQFALAVLTAAASTNTPVVLLLIHNLPVSLDALFSAPVPPAAIVDAWAPTTNSDAIAQLLFGKANRWGRSVLTVYPAAYQNYVSLYDMGNAPSPTNAGRSYRYYDGRAGKALVRFGEGLSGYSTFSLACALMGQTSSEVNVGCNITHTGGPGGDEVLMVFHRPGPDVVAKVGGAHPLPLMALRDFARTSLPVGGVQGVSFTLALNTSLTFVNGEGASVLYDGEHLLDVWNGNDQNATLSVQVQGGGIVRSPPLPK